MLLLSPLAYPIAKMLDYAFHSEDDSCSINLFNRDELAALVRIQYEERIIAKTSSKAQMMRMSMSISHEDDEDEELNGNHSEYQSTSSRSIREAVTKYEVSQTMRALRRADNQSFESLCLDEVGIAEGALRLGATKAIDVYTPLSKVFGIPLDATLTEKLIVDIYRSGYSRIPVYENDAPHAIRGVLLTRQLVVVSPSDERKVDTLPLMQPICVSPQEDVLTLINEFQTGGSANRGGHQAIVCSNPELANDALDNGKAIPEEAGVMGIVTFEDVIEELLQEEIYDEMDHAERSAGWAVNDLFTKWWKERQHERLTAKISVTAASLSKNLPIEPATKQKKEDQTTQENKTKEIDESISQTTALLPSSTDDTTNLMTIDESEQSSSYGTINSV